MKASIRLEHELLAVESEHQVHVMLELVAPPLAGERPRQPFHLALVIDRSGSMAGPKLQTTKECAAFLLRRLAPTDELALIDYDDTVRLLAPLAPVGKSNALDMLPQILAAGSTNLSGGWLKGLEELQRVVDDGPRKVLLLTDGQANVGVTEPGALEAMARNAATAGISTTTIGFGQDFAEDLLTAMADAGRGNAHYAATPDEAPAIFASEFEGLTSLVAQNVSVEIRPSDEVRMLGVLNEFPAVSLPGGVQVQLGDTYAEETRRLVFELHVPQLAALGVAKVADVVVRYVSVGEEVAAHELTLPIHVNLVSADEAAAAGPDHEVAEEVLILKSARAQEEARRMADDGNFEGAREVLRGAAEALRARAPESQKAAELLEQAASMEESQRLMAAPTYTPGMRKSMVYEERKLRSRRSRPTGGGSGSTGH